MVNKPETYLTIRQQTNSRSVNSLSNFFNVMYRLLAVACQ